MTDDGDDTNLDYLAVTRSAASDPFTMLFNLLALLADSRGFKRSLQGLHRAMVAADEAEKQLAGKVTAFAEHEAAARAALIKRENEIDERMAAVAAAEGMLSMRQADVAAQEIAWRNLGESAEVASGFRNPSAPPIAKARASFKAGNREGTGRVPFLKQDGADRLDVSGEPFPGHVSLTRDVPERRP